MTTNIIGIIDDDAIYQFTTKKIIEATSSVEKILVFSDGEEAFSFFTENINNIEALPDVIFLDLNMPYMDGWDFLKEYAIIKPQLSKTIVIYIVSSSVSEIDIERAKGISNVSGYLVKPITTDKFALLIKELQLQ